MKDSRKQRWEVVVLCFVDIIDSSFLCLLKGLVFALFMKYVD